MTPDVRMAVAELLETDGDNYRVCHRAYMSLDPENDRELSSLDKISWHRHGPARFLELLLK